LKKDPVEMKTIRFKIDEKLLKKVEAIRGSSPQIIKLEHKEMTVPEVEQLYYEVKSQSKPEVLSRLIDINDIKLSLVFSNTKKRDELVNKPEDNHSNNQISNLVNEFEKLRAEMAYKDALIKSMKDDKIKDMQNQLNSLHFEYQKLLNQLLKPRPHKWWKFWN